MGKNENDALLAFHFPALFMNSFGFSFSCIIYVFFLFSSAAAKKVFSSSVVLTIENFQRIQIISVSPKKYEISDVILDN